MKQENFWTALIGALVWCFPVKAEITGIWAVSPEAVTFGEENAGQNLAGIYWLPDFLKDNLDRNSRTEEDNGASDKPGNCATYGGFSSCGSPKVYDKIIKPLQGMVCYVNCRCPASYIHTASNCNTVGFILGGGSCDGKFKSCTAKACPGGSKTACASNEIATFNGSYSGNNQCFNCRLKTCAEDGPACASGSKCVGSGAGASCKNDTCAPGSQKATCDTLNYTQSSAAATEAGTACYRCTAKPCPQPKSCDYGCAGYDSSRLSMCGQVCNACKSCVKNDCSAYPLGLAPANAAYQTCTPGCNDSTVTYKFVSCNGGYVNTDSFWCQRPVTTNCAVLGYSRYGCGADQTAISCPYDRTVKACFDI